MNLPSLVSLAIITNYKYCMYDIIFLMTKSPLSNIPMDWIRAFEAAGRLGNFTAAARETGLTQAAISQRINKLEQRIGASLFERKARGVDLTVAGEAWLPYVSRAFFALDISARELFSSQRQTITISASSSIIDLWISPRLPVLLRREAANFSLKTLVLNPKSPVRPNELSVLYGHGQWNNTLKTELYREQLSPLASPSLIQQSRDWQSLPRISLTGPRKNWRDWAETNGGQESQAPTLRFDSFASALAAAKAGLGVLLASLPLCQHEIKSGELVRLSNKVLSSNSSYWLLAHETDISLDRWNRLVSVLTK